MIDWQMNEQGSQRTVDCPAVFAPLPVPFLNLELAMLPIVMVSAMFSPSATRRTRGMLLTIYAKICVPNPSKVGDPFAMSNECSSDGTRIMELGLVV
jgi:hypothetical protein